MRGNQGVAYMSRRRFSVNDLVPSQSEACDASVPRGAKMPKRASQSGETCRAAKRARNKDDSSARKISSSKLLRTGKQHRRQTAVGIFCRLALTPLARSDLGLVLCCDITLWTLSDRERERAENKRMSRSNPYAFRYFLSLWRRTEAISTL